MFDQSTGDMIFGDSGREETISVKPLPTNSNELQKAIARGSGGQIIVAYLSEFTLSQAAVIYLVNLNPYGIKNRIFLGNKIFY